MDLLILSGFLGSGKTTMLLSTIEKIHALKGRKVAVVVNDFGKMGIDGKVMEKFGLRVKELPSGCICCTLGSDLLNTLKTLGEAFQPDLVVIEPSGVADPGAIRGLLRFHKSPPLNSVKTVVLVDALRYESISKALGPLIRKQMEAADLILINKVDEVGEEAVRLIEKGIRDLAVKARIIPTSAKAGTNLEEVVEAMVA